MKKLFCVLLALTMLCSLAACGKQEAAPATVAAPVDVPTATAAPLHAIALQNAKVEGEDYVIVENEGKLLARAVLPDKATAVDYWLVNSEKVQPEGRRYTLEFDSTGVTAVTAVLREKLNVTCEGCYLQFVDDNGNRGGEAYKKVYFEDNYTIPFTGEVHPGGILNCYIGAETKGKTVDYWIINGIVVRFNNPVSGFTLVGVDRSLDIKVVLTDGNMTPAVDLILTYDPNPNPIDWLPDDIPFGYEEFDEPENEIYDDWQPDADTPATTYPPTVVPDSGTPVQPTPAPNYNPTPNPNPSTPSTPHEHNWMFDASDSYPESCEHDGQNTYFCDCGETYRESIPAHGHMCQYRCNDSGWNGTHTQYCIICGQEFETNAHVWVQVEGFTIWDCLACGAEYRGIA